MPTASLHAWRSDDANNDMRFRLLDINTPAHEAKIKVSLLRAREVQVTVVITACKKAPLQRGSWRAPYDTGLETTFTYRGREMTFNWLLVDNTGCYQEVNAAEMMLLPWNTTPERGPTIRTRATQSLLGHDQDHLA